MSWFRALKKKVGDQLAKGLAGGIAKAIGAALGGLLIGACLYIWHVVDPKSTYTAEPSSLASHFVSLAQIFNQIERDSHVACVGGWDERIGSLGLRTCYKFTFSPPSIYKITVCSHDQRTAQIKTSDQLAAFRYFEQRFAPLECFRSLQRGSDHAYDIVSAKDTQFRTIKFPGDPPQEVAFCGCNDQERKEIAATIGATVK